MAYFRELPNLDYQSPFLDKNSSLDYVRTKNLFRRVKLLDWLSDKATLFHKYVIPEGSRPDIVAEELYGSAELDWVVCLTAGITNVRTEWPQNNHNLYNFVEQKYTLEKMNAIHHYETKEVRDSYGRLILPAGQVVDQNFSIPPAYNSATSSVFYNIVSPGETVKDTTVYDTGGNINPVIGVTNYEYETKLNEDKRTIQILRSGYLQQFLNDMRTAMSYEESSQYINSTLIRTDNTRLIGP